MSSRLSPEDYTDPRCPFCTEQYEKEPPVRRIPVDRVQQKLDAYLGANDFAGAERHLRYWLEEARAGRDDRGLFYLHNELMGFYRKRGREAEALENAREALALIEPMELEGSSAAGTAYVNVATVYKTFNRAAEALPYFERAQAVYERALPAGDARLGGLYNNMALALADLKRFAEAKSYYAKALAVMEQVPNGAPEQAITYLNMANLLEAELGAEEAESAINTYLDKAEILLNSPGTPRNGYYAFVCDTCAPTFLYYGRFFYAQELKERAEKIHAGA